MNEPVVDVHSHAMPMPLLWWLGERRLADLSRLHADVIRLDAVSATVPGASAHDAPRQILRDVTAEFRPGESHLILGPNGSGKTTLIRLLAGFHPPASGRVLLGGAPIERGRDAPSLWPRVAVLFEEPDPQFLTDSVEAEIAFGLESLALPPEEIRARTAEVVEAYGLTGFEGRAPQTLSRPTGRPLRSRASPALG